MKRTAGALPGSKACTLSLREKKHADTLEWLKKVVDQCQEPVADLSTVPEYVDFIRSPQYRTWEAWYRSRGKPE